MKVLFDFSRPNSTAQTLSAQHTLRESEQSKVIPNTRALGGFYGTPLQLSSLNEKLLLHSDKGHFSMYGLLIELTNFTFCSYVNPSREMVNLLGRDVIDLDERRLLEVRRYALTLCRQISLLVCILFTSPCSVLNQSSLMPIIALRN